VNNQSWKNRKEKNQKNWKVLSESLVELTLLMLSLALLVEHPSGHGGMSHAIRDKPKGRLSSSS
jgi:hypothetical protein